MAFDAEAEPERSLQWSWRRMRSASIIPATQIERLAERLRSLNYRDIVGRPKEGEKALGPALAVAIGVSLAMSVKCCRNAVLGKLGRSRKN
jgi:ParB family chromosome partitioning protein